MRILLFFWIIFIYISLSLETPGILLANVQSIQHKLDEAPQGHWGLQDNRQSFFPFLRQGQGWWSGAPLSPGLADNEASAVSSGVHCHRLFCLHSSDVDLDVSSCELYKALVRHQSRHPEAALNVTLIEQLFQTSPAHQGHKDTGPLLRSRSQSLPVFGKSHHAPSS